MGRGRLRGGRRMPGIAPRAAQNRGLGTPAFADGPACGDKGTALFRNSDAARPEKSSERSLAGLPGSGKIRTFVRKPNQT